jgi:hypothetical protein
MKTSKMSFHKSKKALSESIYGTFRKELIAYFLMPDTMYFYYGIAI